MRVVHLMKVTGVAGAERHLLALLPPLRAREIDVRLIVLAEPRGRAERLIDPARALGVPGEAVTIRGDADPSLVPRLTWRLRALGPDIVHTHLVHADTHGIPAARLARVPVVVTTRHNDDAFRRRPFWRCVNRALWRRVEGGIAVSGAVARFSVEVEGAPAERLRVIHHGLSLPDHRGERENVRRELGCLPGMLLVGMVGRLTRQKGIDVGLEAFAAAAGSGTDSRLVIVGDGPLRARLGRRAAELGLGPRVAFLGWRDDAARIMAGLDVLMAPSRWEGFGIVLLEAMAQGVAIVASDAGAIPEVVGRSAGGLLAPAGDAAALGDRLYKLMLDESERLRLGAAGRERLRASFTVDRMADETLAFYREMTR